MAELGWVGIAFDEKVGGAAMGMAELAVVLEALGRHLVPEPFIGCAVLAGDLLARAGSPAQREAWLKPLVAGEKVVALAHAEAGSRYDTCRVATRAAAQGDGWQLDGEKLQVLDGDGADALIVSARSGGDEGGREGIDLFLVPCDAAGLTVERQRRVDSRNAARVTLEGVRVTRDARLGEAQSAGRLLERVTDRATVALCAEMLGGMSQALDLTLDYLKNREQFGVLIGSFQALKHRAARVFIDVELSRSSVMAAARALDRFEAERGAGPDTESEAGYRDVAKLVSLAKARCSDAYLLAANEGVQMFGGVGMTDEYDIGLYLKRARASELSFGDGAHHRNRWASLSGY